MTCLVEVLRGMLVLRRVTAANMATAQAKAKMYPGIANLHAVLTHILVCAFDLDLVYMFAAFSHKEAPFQMVSGKATLKSLSLEASPC